MPREPRLDMLPDKDMKLSGTHFRKVVRRIESIVPLAGYGIIVTPKDGGHEVKIDTNVVSGGDGGGGVGACGFASSGFADLFQVITLNVCSNGTPTTLFVYGPAGQNPDAMSC